MDSQTYITIDEYAGTMLDHVPAGVALFDARDLRLLAANKLFYRFFETHYVPSCDAETFIGHTLTEWLSAADPTDAAALIAIFRNVAETGIPYQTEEYTAPVLNRDQMYWDWSLHPVCHEHGHIIQLIFHGSDVTAHLLARQQAEQAHTSLTHAHPTSEIARKRLEVIETVARGTRASLDIRSVGQATINAISAYLKPLQLTIHVADPVRQALRLLCLCSAQEREASLRTLESIPYDSLLLPAQARKRYDPIFVEDVQIAVASGRLGDDFPLMSPEVRGYICIPLWLKDHFEGTLSACFPKPIDPQGPEAQTLLGCSSHLTAALAHARFHAAVEDERARIRAILDQLSEGILLVEATDGNISYANASAATILGTLIQDLVGVSFYQHAQSHSSNDIHDQQALPWNFVVINALCGNTTSSQETVVVKPDGTTLILLSSSAPLHNEEGFITGAVIVFQDMTAQKLIERQKNAFLSLASHELRTPLTAIMGFAEILQLKSAQEEGLDPISRRAITQIVAQSDQLTRLINEMLDLTRLENAELSLDCDLHDLHATLKEAIESQEIAARGHCIRMVSKGLAEADMVIGYFDKQRVMQIMNNLISNAIKYSPNGSEIEVGLQRTLENPDEALIWVRDHGIGIPRNEVHLIFQRFYRASNLEKSMSGLGLGLYLVKELVTRHKGRVWVESTEGEGSTFYVLLPLKKERH
jgi:PAS domain S-box-containing protein